MYIHHSWTSLYSYICTYITAGHLYIATCVRTFPNTPMAFDPRLSVLVSGRSSSLLLPVSVRTTWWVKGEVSVPMMRRAFGPWMRICGEIEGDGGGGAQRRGEEGMEIE